MRDHEINGVTNVEYQLVDEADATYFDDYSLVKDQHGDFYVVGMEEKHPVKDEIEGMLLYSKLQTDSVASVAIGVLKNHGFKFDGETDNEFENMKDFWFRGRYGFTEDEDIDLLCHLFNAEKWANDGIEIISKGSGLFKNVLIQWHLQFLNAPGDNEKHFTLFVGYEHKCPTFSFEPDEVYFGEAEPHHIAV